MHRWNCNVRRSCDSRRGPSRNRYDSGHDAAHAFSRCAPPQPDGQTNKQRAAECHVDHSLVLHAQRACIQPARWDLAAGVEVRRRHWHFHQPRSALAVRVLEQAAWLLPATHHTCTHAQMSLTSDRSSAWSLLLLLLLLGTPSFKFLKLPIYNRSTQPCDVQDPTYNASLQRSPYPWSQLVPPRCAPAAQRAQAAPRRPRHRAHQRAEPRIVTDSPISD